MAGLSITPVSKRKARSGNRNQNTQLEALEREAGATPAVRRPADPSSFDKPNDDSRAFLKRMKEREAARRARRGQ